MQINIIIQLFLVITITLMLVIVTKTYYKFRKQQHLIRDSILLSFITMLLLLLPVYCNNITSQFILEHNEMTFYLYLAGLVAFSLIYLIFIYLFDPAGVILDKIVYFLFKIPAVKDCKDLILKNTHPGWSYTSKELSKKLKINEYKLFKALNLLVLDKKVKLAINSAGEPIYFIL